MVRLAPLLGGATAMSKGFATEFGYQASLDRGAACFLDRMAHSINHAADSIWP